MFSILELDLLDILSSFLLHYHYLGMGERITLGGKDSIKDSIGDSIGDMDRRIGGVNKFPLLEGQWGRRK